MSERVPAYKGIERATKAMLFSALALFVLNDSLLIALIAGSARGIRVLNDMNAAVSRIASVETNELHYRIGGDRSFVLENTLAIDSSLSQLSALEDEALGISGAASFARLSGMLSSYSSLFLAYSGKRDQADALRSGLDRAYAKLEAAFGEAPLDAPPYAAPFNEALLMARNLRIAELGLYDGKIPFDVSVPRLSDAVDAIVAITDRLDRLEAPGNDFGLRSGAYRCRMAIMDYAGLAGKLPPLMLERERSEAELGLFYKDLADARAALSSGAERLMDSRLKGAIAAALAISAVIVALALGAARILGERIATQTRIAEEATRAKSDFLAVMSHEMRTPLNAVVTMTGLLADTRLDERQTEYLQLAKAGGEGLLALINDLLDFSKIEAGKLELESGSFDLRESVHNALLLFAARAYEKGIDLILDIERPVPPFISGDSGRLGQIVANLVANAVKFTDSGEILVSIRLKGRDRDGRVVLSFSVRDTGPGIPPERMDRLFKDYSQVDASVSRRYGGTGLGLSICKNLAELMGGTISVASDGVPGKGSEFTVVLPFEAVDAPVPAYLSGAATELAGNRALVIGKSAASMNALTALLEGWKVSVRACADIECASDALLAAPPYGFVLVDYNPGLGVCADCVTRLRELMAPERVPVVFMAPMGSLPDELGSGVFRLSKPIKAASLFERLAACLKERRPDHERAALPPPGSLRILVAEDSAVNARVVRHLLESMGQNPAMATNGQEALDIMRERKLDIVFMDTAMPLLDGFETARLARDTIPPENRPRIVALTGAAMEGDRERCLEAGMDGYMLKPIRPAELARELRVAAGMPPAAETGTGSPEEPVPAGGSMPPADGETLPLLDQEDFRAMLDNMGEVAGEVLALFEAEGPPKLARLAEAMKVGNVDELVAQSHAFKSTSALIGAARLAGSLESIERRLRSGESPAELASAVRSLAELYDRTMAEIRRAGKRP